MRRILFQEKQSFGSLSLYLSMGVIYLATMLIFGYGIYKQIVAGEPWGDKPMSDTGLIITAVLVFIILIVSALLLFGATLVTIVYNDCISITFKPYFRKPVTYYPSDIERYEIREYKPIKEYGGWGVRFGSKSIGKAYNVRGNQGLQLHLKDGKKLLIGTQRGEALLLSMSKMMGER